MDHPKFIVLNQKDESISIQRGEIFLISDHEQHYYENHGDDDDYDSEQDDEDY